MVCISAAAFFYEPVVDDVYEHTDDMPASYNKISYDKSLILFNKAPYKECNDEYTADPAIDLFELFHNCSI